MFPGGNTSVGFFSYYDYIIERDATRIFILKGGPGVGKSTFMTKVGDEMLKRGYDVEFHHCSSDNDSLDGVCIPAIKVALLDGTAPHIVDPKSPGAVDEIINLGEFWDEELLRSHKREILETEKRISRLFGMAYSLLKEARVAYEEWSGYIAESMNMGELNRVRNELNAKVFEGVEPDYSQAPKVRHLFGSAITPGGPRNYTDTLLDSVMKIYAIKGDPGTSVNDIIKEIAVKAERMGIYTEQFHCPFIPERVDLLIIPSIKVAVVNTSQPMHMDVTKVEGLHIVEEIDLSKLIRWEILAYYSNEAEDARNRYQSLVEKAVARIKKAKEAHDAMEKFYIPAMNFDAMNKKQDEIMERILKYAGEI